ncbi:MAG: DUF222 domain-containing protein [Mycobacteriales bacterium]
MSEGVTVTEIQEFLDRLAAPACGSDPAAVIRQVAALERLKGAASAAQARRALALHDGQVRRDRSRAIRPEQSTRSVGAEIALARKESPRRGARFVRLARLLAADLPQVFAALTAGAVSEYRAMLIARETSFLTPEHRRALDAEIGPTLSGLSDQQARASAAAIAYRLDPQAAIDRTSAAETDRHVSVRPAPETMAILRALLPARDGVAVWAALAAATATARAAGDGRTRGQIMADTLVARITGRESTEPTPVELRLLVAENTLHPDDPTPARAEGYGPVPAPLARQLIRVGATAIRRIYTRGGTIIAMDSTAAHFTPAQRDLIVLRDQICRTPFCDAPIRHADHIRPRSAGGPTNLPNGQGLCEGCNYLKEHPDWHTTATDTGLDGTSHTTTITTPTGHRYQSHAPPPLGPGSNPPHESAAEHKKTG